MPRPALSFYTFAPVLAALLSFAAIALVATSRSQLTPRFVDLAVIDGTLRTRSSMLGAAKLRITTGAGEQTVDAAACTALTSALRPGDQIAVWVDKNARVWRVVRAWVVAVKSRPPTGDLTGDSCSEAAESFWLRNNNDVAECDLGVVLGG